MKLPGGGAGAEPPPPHAVKRKTTVVSTAVESTFTTRLRALRTAECNPDGNQHKQFRERCNFRVWARDLSGNVHFEMREFRFRILDNFQLENACSIPAEALRPAPGSRKMGLSANLAPTFFLRRFRGSGLLRRTSWTSVRIGETGPARPCAISRMQNTRW